ncbi:cytochrome c oxidase accessory protein CcoG [Phenylobacterium montanum]|uniref:Cytochrome c oxidase accessory protein CcoG n=1 Tax=Phenylobacterium montanum TaxID=2823693 RepID=A0A975FYB4_9CAUL|nr:cytochrome c oxidase accessory protein CcoG [Caulobacter sp. S6]QUD87535.1 cytochrome c oxidase accessory protein CcoG [Caulobacter sp. S6]
MTTVINTIGNEAHKRAPAKGSGPSPAGGQPGGLYKKREPIYPKLVHGKWRTIKWLVLIATLGVYYLLPWFRWDRGPSAPSQAVLVDFTHARFYFFFIQLWPQEVYYFTGLLVVAALAMFLVTALFGRLWCGYACPQTVWTDLFIVAERLFEGDRNARMKLDAAPWSFDKAWRKTGKHAVWLAISLATGGAWIFYFHDAPTLMKQLFVGQAPMTAYASAAILTFTTYSLAGTMREQVCTYMCPWPRIQGAMLDDHSLQVTYRVDRGEPRGAHKKGTGWEGRGDCVDCTQCVVVCPMGIDIRDGSQMECINCGLCIDACDDIMTKVGRPRGLIAFDTDAAVLAREEGRKPDYKFIRPRTLYYGVTLAVVSGIMLYGLLTRSPLALDVIRDRNPTFVRLSDGDIRNGYTLKLMNRSNAPATYRISFSGVDGARLKAVGAPMEGDSIDVALGPDGQRSLQVFVTAPAPQDERHSTPALFKINSPAGEAVKKTVFLSGDEGHGDEER